MLLSTQYHLFTQVQQCAIYGLFGSEADIRSKCYRRRKYPSELQEILGNTYNMILPHPQILTFNPPKGLRNSRTYQFHRLKRIRSKSYPLYQPSFLPSSRLLGQENFTNTSTYLRRYIPCFVDCEVDVWVLARYADGEG